MISTEVGGRNYCGLVIERLLLKRSAQSGSLEENRKQKLDGWIDGWTDGWMDGKEGKPFHKKSL